MSLLSFWKVEQGKDLKHCNRMSAALGGGCHWGNSVDIVTAEKWDVPQGKCNFSV